MNNQYSVIINMQFLCTAVRNNYCYLCCLLCTYTMAKFEFEMCLNIVSTRITYHWHKLTVDYLQNFWFTNTL